MRRKCVQIFTFFTTSYICKCDPNKLRKCKVRTNKQLPPYIFVQYYRSHIFEIDSYFSPERTFEEMREMLIYITALKGVYFIPVVGQNNAREGPRRPDRRCRSNLNNQKYSNIIEFIYRCPRASAVDRCCARQHDKSGTSLTFPSHFR